MRGAAKHPAKHRTTPTRNCPAPNAAVPRLRNCLVTVYSLAKQRLCVEHVTEKDTLAAGHRPWRIIPFFFNCLSLLHFKKFFDGLILNFFPYYMLEQGKRYHSKTP